MISKYSYLSKEEIAFKKIGRYHIRLCRLELTDMSIEYEASVWLDSVNIVESVTYTEPGKARMTYTYYCDKYSKIGKK